MIALPIINDLNILSIKLGYSEIPLSIFEFFQFLMDILKIWQTGFLYCWLIIINTIVDFSIFLTWELNYNARRKCIENDIDNYCKRSRNNEIYKKWLAPGLDQRFLSKLIHPIIWHIAVYNTVKRWRVSAIITFYHIKITKSQFLNS